MKIVILAVAAVMLAGCEDPAYAPAAHLDSAAAALVQDEQVKAAIIRQQAIYPYHFEIDSPVENELGRHDLALLADHYRVRPGTLVIRRGGANAKLYDARVRAVLDFLSRAGVPSDRVHVEDSLPGGEGTAAERIVLVLAPKKEPRAPAPLPAVDGAGPAAPGPGSEP